MMSGLSPCAMKNLYLRRLQDGEGSSFKMPLDLVIKHMPLCRMVLDMFLYMLGHMVVQHAQWFWLMRVSGIGCINPSILCRAGAVGVAVQFNSQFEPTPGRHDVAARRHVVTVRVLTCSHCHRLVATVAVLWNQGLRTAISKM